MVVGRVRGDDNNSDEPPLCSSIKFANSAPHVPDSAFGAAYHFRLRRGEQTRVNDVVRGVPGAPLGDAGADALPPSAVFAWRSGTTCRTTSSSGRAPFVSRRRRMRSVTTMRFAASMTPWCALCGTKE